MTTTTRPSLAESKVDKRTFYKDPAPFLAQMAKLEAWVEAHPRDGDAWLVLGYNHLFSGAIKKARESFTKVADLVPGDLASKTFLEAIGRLEGSPEQKKKDKKITRF